MMERLYHAMRSHNFLLELLREQLGELNKRLDGLTRRLDQDKESVKAFKSAAHEITPRRPPFLGMILDEPEDDEDDFYDDYEDDEEDNVE